MDRMTKGIFELTRRLLLATALVIALALGAPAQIAPPAARTVDVEKGQLLELELVTPISSATATVGQKVSFRLTEPLVASGEIVLPAGWELTGRVTKAEKAGPNCRQGKLEWRLDDAKTPDGSTVPLRPAFAIHKRGSGKLVELNPPPSSREKIKKALLAPLIAAGVVVSLPVALPLLAAEREPACTDQGLDRSYKAGWISHAAAREGVRVRLGLKATDEAPSPSASPAVR